MDMFVYIYNAAVRVLHSPVFVFILSFVMPQRRTFVDASTGTDEEYDEIDCEFSRFSIGLDQWNRVDTNESPVNIIDNRVPEIPMDEYFLWYNYEDMPQILTLENNGHTVILRGSFSRNNWPLIRGAHLTSSYEFVEIRFRWGCLYDKGSEHAINTRRFPLELQTMHSAAPSAGQLPIYDILMIGYMFQIKSHNQYLEPIILNLHRIIKPGSKIEIAPFPLSFLVHQFRSGFYSFDGSTTEPCCHKSAKWIVFPEPLDISERQIKEFTQLSTSDGNTGNSRTAQPQLKTPEAGPPIEDKSNDP